MGVNEDDLCLAPSRSKWNFVRTWYCSLPKGHGPSNTSPHIAYENHDTNGEVAWLGPWEDGSYYEAPEGYDQWTPPDTSSSG